MTDPSTTSAIYDAMAEKWALPQTLMGGTPAMLRAGSQYLPRHPAENATVYRERVNRAVLRNYYRRTVQKIVGRVFSNPIIPSPDMPVTLLDSLKNVDFLGRGLNNFAQDWFQDALICGLSYVLVDFPNSPMNGVSDEESRRPYAVHIPAEQVIAVQWESNGSIPRLSQVRIREQCRDYNGFGEESRSRVRVLEPNSWTLYQESDKGAWHIVDEGVNSLGEIPLVTLYANRTGFMQATPPLEDLAYLNLEHYQIRSDQRNALNVASFPILAASGYDPEIDGPIEVGPNKVLTTSDTDGKYYYVESSGAALEAGSRELANLEKAIHLFGLQFENGSRNETATGRMLDAADVMSPVVAMTMELENSLNSMLALFAKWGGIDDAGTLKIQSTITESSPSSNNVTDLLSLWQAGAITQKELHNEITSRGVISDSLAFNASAD
ncbi:hypothetical protein A9Q83_13645 [Alphaproteobacteria bacterium 46_93_T64]|nr:hypothetical protein A9Q83_13645 [Alphaproteobacteria bacterium 46_93_T64]